MGRRTRIALTTVAGVALGGAGAFAVATPGDDGDSDDDGGYSDDDDGDSDDDGGYSDDDGQDDEHADEAPESEDAPGAENSGSEGFDD